MAVAVKERLGADGVRLVQNNGRAAGQVINHVHFHVIPFYIGEPPRRRRLDPREGEKLQRMLSEAVRNVA